MTQRPAKAVAQALLLFGNFHAGVVTAAYAGDAISENEGYERCGDPRLNKAMRDEIAVL